MKIAKKRKPIKQAPPPEVEAAIAPQETPTTEVSEEAFAEAVKAGAEVSKVEVSKGEVEGEAVIDLEAKPATKEDLEKLGDKIVNEPTGAQAEHDAQTLRIAAVELGTSIPEPGDVVEKATAAEAPKEIPPDVGVIEADGPDNALDENDFGTGKVVFDPSGQVSIPPDVQPELGDDEEEVFVMPQWAVMELSSMWVNLLHMMQSRGEYKGPLPAAFAGTIHDDGSVYLEAVDLPHNVVVVAPRAPRQFHPHQQQFAGPPQQSSQPQQGPEEPEEPRRPIRTLCLSDDGSEILDADNS